MRGLAALAASACALLVLAGVTTTRTLAAGSLYSTTGYVNVAEFAIEGGGELTRTLPGPGQIGVGPEGVAVTPDGKSVYIANGYYENGQPSAVAEFNVNTTTGGLTLKSQGYAAAGEGADAIVVAPNGKSAYVVNFENTVSQFSIDPSTGELSPTAPSSISVGCPSAIAISPSGASVYVTSRCTNEVDEYNVNPSTGALSPKTPGSLATGPDPHSVTVSPDGKSVYVADSESISQYDVNSATGALSAKSPASVGLAGELGGIAVTPDSKNAYVTDTTSNTVAQFHVEPATGDLVSGASAIAAGVEPVAIIVTPDGKHVYAANVGRSGFFFHQTISMYNVNEETGALVPQAPASIGAVGEGPGQEEEPGARGLAIGVYPRTPLFSSESATQLTRTTATLNAALDPNGGTISACRFEYGTSTSYGTSVSCSPTTPYTSPTAVSAAITKLSAQTTYHFRVVATNGSGTSHSADAVFTTLPHVPTSEVGATTAITSSSATFNGTVNPNGADVTACEFIYEAGAPVTTGSHRVPCASLPGSGTSAVAVSAHVASLAGPGANTEYHVTLVAKNSVGGNLALTEPYRETTFLTLPNPPVTETLAASNVTQTSALLNARVNPSGVQLTECEFQYGPGFSRTAPCSVPQASGGGFVSESAEVTELTPGSSFNFRVIARNPGGQSQGAVESVSLPNYPTVQSKGTAHGLVTVEGQGGTLTSGLSSVEVNPKEGLPGLPGEAVAVVGGLTYEISEVSPGGTVKVVLHLPPGSEEPQSVYKLEGGYYVDIDNIATISHETVTLLLTDGGEGDEDEHVNGRIVDPVVPLHDASPPARSQFGRCLRVAEEGGGYHGSYTNSGCTKASATKTGKYEWTEVIEAEGFEGSSTGTPKLQSALGEGAASITCSAGTTTGFYTGALGLRGRIRLTGCESPGVGQSCSSEGLEPGEVESGLLQGELGWQSRPKVALRLHVSGTGPFMKFSCGGATVVVNGSVLVPVKAGKMSAGWSLKFKESKGRQKPEALEGGGQSILTASVNGGPSQQVGLSLTTAQISEEAVEVNPDR